jgi:hypothetical protein
MNTTPIKCQAPIPSAIAAYLPGAYFYDSWSIYSAYPALSPLGQFLIALSATPAWVDVLMSVRNSMAARIGLKNLGALSRLDRTKVESEYAPGDRVGIFTLIANTAEEVLLGDKDKHLDVMLSVHKSAEADGAKVVVTVTTVVHVHNWLGRLYMAPVAPMHRIIAPTVLKAIGNVREAS